MWRRRLHQGARWIAILSSLLFMVIVGGMIWTIVGNGFIGDVPLFLAANIVCLAGTLATIKWPEVGGWLLIAGAAMLMIGESFFPMRDLAGVLPFALVDLILGAALIATSRLARPRVVAA
jgi:hypothetical protein